MTRDFRRAGLGCHIWGQGQIVTNLCIFIVIYTKNTYLSHVRLRDDLSGGGDCRVGFLRGQRGYSDSASNSQGSGSRQICLPPLRWFKRCCDCRPGRCVGTSSWQRRALAASRNFIAVQQLGLGADFETGACATAMSAARCSMQVVLPNRNPLPAGRETRLPFGQAASPSAVPQWHRNADRVALVEAAQYLCQSMPRCKYLFLCCLDVFSRTGKWWARRDLNPQPRDYESPALTVELQALQQLTRYSAVMIHYA